MKNIEEYLDINEHTRKTSTSEPSTVLWSDGQPHDVITSRWECPPAEKYCYRAFNVMHDSNTGVVLGLQALSPVDQVAVVVDVATGDSQLADQAATWATGSGSSESSRQDGTKKRFGDFEITLLRKGSDLLVTVTNWK